MLRLSSTLLLQDASASVDVTVTDGVLTDTSPTQFSYSSAMTPNVLSVNTHSAAIQGMKAETRLEGCNLVIFCKGSQ